MHLHFIGICGKGASGVAKLALNHGFEVSGCDNNLHSESVEAIAGANEIFGEHDVSHLDDADLVIISPATFMQSRKSPDEVDVALERGIAVTWQQFLAEHLIHDKRCVAVSGTHGKTTTTALLGAIAEQQGWDPSVLVGGHAFNWQSNVRCGAGDTFIVEADEYNDNFLHYHPETAVVLNVEIDHPDYFASLSECVDSFAKFVAGIRVGGTLIVNARDTGVRMLVERCEEIIRRNQLTVFSYNLGSSSAPISEADEAIFGYVTGVKSDSFDLAVRGAVELDLKDVLMVGTHNAENLLAAISVILSTGCETETLVEGVKAFRGVERRLQLLHADDRCRVYDDNAHHPSAITKTLEALRDHNPDKQIVAIVEPATISRTVTFFEQYLSAFQHADFAIFTRIYEGREAGQELPDLQVLLEECDAQSSVAFHNDPQQTINLVTSLQRENIIVVVFGDGQAEQLARSIARAAST